MTKKYYCADCGLKLKVTLKAVPQEGRVITLIKPHVCKETSSSDLDKDVPAENFEVLPKEIEKEVNEKVDKLFKDFPSVSKPGTAEHESVLGDKRKKEHLRDELITSSAPLSILSVKGK